MNRDEASTLCGLILSGGESRRMGTDKGLLTTHSQAWVNRAGELLTSVGLAVQVMIREQQQAAYAALISPEFSLVHDLDLPVGGPLKGLLSFHARHPQKDVLVLPSDMPRVTPDLLNELIGFYRKHPNYDAWVFTDSGTLQPFPGLYSARLLARANAAMGTDSPSRQGLTYWLREGTTFVKNSSELHRDAFTQYNRPEDLPLP